MKFESINIDELVAIFVCVVIGTIAHVCFRLALPFLNVEIPEKEKKISLIYIGAILGFNYFSGFVFSELFKDTDYSSKRTLVIIITSFFGAYFIKWIFKNKEKLMDKGASKLGIDIETKEDE